MAAIFVCHHHFKHRRIGQSRHYLRTTYKMQTIMEEQIPLIDQILILVRRIPLAEY